jgi:hypothetical protein
MIAGPKPVSIRVVRTETGWNGAPWPTQLMAATAGDSAGALLCHMINIWIKYGLAF